MGFYELKSMRLPSIRWNEYTGNEKLDDSKLWTIRSAVFCGNDLNLPRLVGVTAAEAQNFADKLLSDMRDKGMVVYYPYFLANKSGTLDVHQDFIVIEAVRKDLWNLVTYSNIDVTIQLSKNSETYTGNKEFLSCKEKEDILSYVPEIRRIFRDELMEGKSILLEWSFAQDCDLEQQVIGEEYLVFYEARTV